MAIRVADAAPRVLDAWTVTRGAGTTLAVVDARVDVRGHPEFADRWVAGCGDNQQAMDRPSATHGAKVAGLALADGRYVTGIAPQAVVLPIAVPTLATTVGHSSETEAIRWAADHGADIICCAWAPPKPTGESGTLTPATRAALEYCLTNGRAGKGCVVVFAAGNDGSDLALNGYASHPGVVAVGACNCHGKHPSYSGWGDALWCVFPSNDPHDPIGASMTYLTTAPVGSLLDGEAYYTTRFGFTSAACAAVAGICALIVSAHPDLTYQEVKAVLRDSCEKIDVESGTYDEHGHSPLYGFGRPDVARAVEIAHEQRLAARD